MRFLKFGLILLLSLIDCKKLEHNKTIFQGLLFNELCKANRLVFSVRDYAYSGNIVHLDTYVVANQNTEDGFYWEQISGPKVIIKDPFSNRAEFTVLTVTEETVAQFGVSYCGNYYKKTINFKVAGFYVDAGSDQSTVSGHTVYLHAIGSSNVSSYNWSLVSGPTSSVTINNSSTANPNILLSTPGIYEFKVSVSVGSSTNYDTVKVSVEPSKTYYLHAGHANITKYSGETVNLVGVEAGGTASSYLWSQYTSTTSVTISNSTSLSASFVAPTVTTDTVLKFKLKATGPNTQIYQTEVTVTVKPIPSGGSFTVAAGTNQTVYEGDVVHLSAAVTNASGTVSYTWSQISGTTVTFSSTSVQNPSFTAPTVTSDTTLVLHDGSGAVTSQVTYTLKNRTVTVSAGTPQTVQTNQKVQLHANPSGGLPAYSYAWTQGSSNPTVTLNNSTTSNPDFTPTTSGTYTFSVVATDSLGNASSSTSVTITVNGPVSSEWIHLGPDLTAKSGVSFNPSYTVSRTSADSKFIISISSVSPSSSTVTLNSSSTVTGSNLAIGLISQSDATVTLKVDYYYSAATTVPVSDTLTVNLQGNNITISQYQCLGPPIICERLKKPKPCPLDSPYGIVVLNNKDTGARTVEYKCATYDTTYKDWYLASSDVERCQKFDFKFVVTFDFSCTYGCAGENCNIIFSKTDDIGGPNTYSHLFSQQSDDPYVSVPSLFRPKAK